MNSNESIKKQKYYLANKERLKESSKVYHLANKDKISARQKTYYLAHRDKILAQCKKYYLANKDKIKAYFKVYNLTNREQRKTRYLLNRKQTARRCERWTKQEIEIVIKDYPDKGAKGLAKLLNRSAQSISLKAMYLGIKYAHIRSQRGREFSEKELEFIKKHYPLRGGTFVAKKLGRSLASIAQKAQDLCVVVNRKEAYKGKNNPHWKGGVTLRRWARESSQYKEWRQEVFERDEWQCKTCGQVGGRLQAHHILSWEKYPEQRFDVNNGITLCIKCHYKLHGKKLKIA